MQKDKKERDVVFDPLRKKYVALTPEENVRQQFIRYLKEKRNWPYSHMISEKEITIGTPPNEVKFRCDIVVYDASLKPTMIVECKAPSVNITKKTFEQIWQYALILRVKWLVVTNGIKSYACQYQINDKGESEYVFINDIPKKA